MFSVCLFHCWSMFCSLSLSLSACVCACVRACVRTCVCVCVCVCFNQVWCCLTSRNMKQLSALFRQVVWESADHNYWMLFLAFSWLISFAKHLYLMRIVTNRDDNSSRQGWMGTCLWSGTLMDRLMKYCKEHVLFVWLHVTAVSSKMWCACWSVTIAAKMVLHKM